MSGNKDLKIYKSRIHEEWSRVLFNLKSNDAHYIVPYRMCLDMQGGINHLTATPVLDGLSDEAIKKARELSFVTYRPATVSDLLTIMAANPTMCAEDLKDGFETTMLVDKYLVDYKLAKLAPDVQMKDYKLGFRDVCRLQYGDSLGLHSTFILYALHGIDIHLRLGASIDRHGIDSIVGSLPPGDFGLAEVADAQALWNMITGHQMQAARTAREFAEILADIDALFAEKGTPVLRPDPAAPLLVEIHQLTTK